MRGPRDDFVGAPEGRRPHMTQKSRAPGPNAAPPERFRRAHFRAACSLASADFFRVMRVLSPSIRTSDGLQDLRLLPVAVIMPIEPHNQSRSHRPAPKTRQAAAPGGP